jgi:hypothetical protein
MQNGGIKTRIICKDTHSVVINHQGLNPSGYIGLSHFE